MFYDWINISQDYYSEITKKKFSHSKDFSVCFCCKRCVGDLVVEGNDNNQQLLVKGKRMHKFKMIKTIS